MTKFHDSIRVLPLNIRVRYSDKPMPERYTRQPIIQCAKCKAATYVIVRKELKAVRCRTITGGLAYLECKVCGHRFKMAVEK